MSSLPPTSANARFEPALGCQECFARNECGGLHTPGPLDCFCPTCNPDKCTYLCPRSKNFLPVWRDTDGTRITTTFLRQEHTPPPAYVPLIQHGSRRTTPLRASWAALTTFDVTRHDKRAKDMLRDPETLRAKFQLQPTTRVILSSIAPDRELERYWRDRHQRSLVEGIKHVNPAHVIAPNFSLFHDVPRFDHLANIKRSVLCAEEFSKVGISVIPYIAGITATDWERWASLLNEHQTITMVCKEFQTGPSNKDIGEWHIRRIEELQQRIGRALHLIAIAGRRHLRRLRAFPNVTIVDSVPFMRTMHRQQLTKSVWQKAPTPYETPLDELLQGNVDAYAARLHPVRQQRAIIPRCPVQSADRAQLILPFTSPAAAIPSMPAQPQAS